MRRVPEINAAYAWMVAAHEKDYLLALAADDTTGQARLDTARDHLERGIFVLLFAEFEVAMNEALERARLARQFNADWTVRRGWDTPEMRRKRPSFETRLAMTLDRTGTEFAEITAAYEIRNACAHGKTTISVGSIDRLVMNLYRWQAAL